ncbi:MAG: hypothetical protein Q9160_006209 [Pyrenula sp. 1 TL-2023]
MSDFAKQGSVIDLAIWINMYTFDVLGELFYGKMFGFMKERKDIGNYMRAIHSLLPVFTIGGTLPSYLTKPFFLSTLIFAPSVRGALGAVKHIEMASRAAVTEREQELKKENDNRRDMLRKMLDISHDRGESIGFNKEDVIVESHSSLFAGADTTAIAINSVIYHLARNPAAYEKLTAEVDAAVINGTLSIPTTYAEAAKLPYLTACINEGMRLHPSVGLTMPRVVPPCGATVSGFHLPEGCRIGINGAVVQYDREVFGADADVFSPDRWINGNATVMDRAMIQFGAGPRTCIGRNISLSEIYKLIPQLVRLFHFRLEDPNKEWKTRNYWFNKQSGINAYVEERKHNP